MRAHPLTIPVCVATSLLFGAAHAGQYSQPCESATDQANTQCDGAIQGAKGVDKGNETSGLAAMGENVNSNSIVQKPGITSNDAAIGQAIQTCQGAKQQCSSQCQAAAGRAQAAIPRDPSAAGDLATIKQTKSQKCEQDIQKKIDEAQASKSPLGKQAQEAQNTKDASDKGGGGGMPQMPQMPQKDDSKDSGSSPSMITPTQSALNCNATDASRFSDCNKSFVSKCMASMAAAECDTFTDRYCNLSSGAATPALSQATTNLVIDQRNEGLGSNYCNYALSARYCQTSGREQCPSCTQMVAQQQCSENNVCNTAQSSAAAVNALRTSCPDDPYFVTGGFTLSPLAGAAASYAATLPATGSTGLVMSNGSLLSATPATGAAASTPNANGITPASGAGGAGGGGFGGGSGGSFGGGVTAASAGGAAGAGVGATREGLPNGIIPSSAAVDGGGGGSAGGDGGGAGAEAAVTAGDIKLALDRRAPASTVQGLSSDVAATAGPSIFSIGSVGIRNFCARSQLTGCAK